MNALTTIRLPPPTADEPIPTIAGTHGLTLLRSAPVSSLIQSQSEDLEAMKETALAICASLTPPRDEVIALEIESLSLHYPAMSRTRAESQLVIRHWLADLADIPADLIVEACRLWRNSAERFFPTPGQLKALVEPMLKHRQALAKRANDFLEAIAA